MKWVVLDFSSAVDVFWHIVYFSISFQWNRHHSCFDETIIVSLENVILLWFRRSSISNIHVCHIVTRRRCSGRTQYLLSILAVDEDWGGSISVRSFFFISSATYSTCEYSSETLKNCTHKFQKRTKHHIWVGCLLYLLLFCCRLSSGRVWHLVAIKVSTVYVVDALYCTICSRLTA